MEYVEIIVAFLIGLFLVIMLGWVFSLKTKGIMRVVINAVAGAVVLLCLALFKVAALPVNPLNALIVGFLGLPGLVVIYLVTLYL